MNKTRPPARSFLRDASVCDGASDDELQLVTTAAATTTLTTEFRTPSARVISSYRRNWYVNADWQTFRMLIIRSEQMEVFNRIAFDQFVAATEAHLHSSYPNAAKRHALEMA